MKAIQARNASGEVDEAARRRALEDPDVKAARNDPRVSSILTQAQSGDTGIIFRSVFLFCFVFVNGKENCFFSFRAMRDKPEIAEKIELLMAAGVLSMRSA